MAYGHRKKGDCDDIELLVPISSSNKSEHADNSYELLGFRP